MDATVVCKQTMQGDTGRAIYIPRDHNYTSKMGGVSCMGHESDINDCGFYANYGQCYHDDAGAECSYTTTSGGGEFLFP